MDIDIPIGKALLPVEKEGDSCNGCYFDYGGETRCVRLAGFECRGKRRRDGKDIIFKVIDCQLIEGINEGFSSRDI